MKIQGYPPPITFTRLPLYDDYLASHAGAPLPVDTINVDIFNVKESVNTEILSDLSGFASVIVSEGGYAVWEVDVPSEGLYNLCLEYYPISSRGVDIEFRIDINGEPPFSGADMLMMTRIWTDGGIVRQDNRGNDIRPMQVEAPRWELRYFSDAMGYVTEPYLFYFNKGVNTIELTPINEPIAMRGLFLENKSPTSSYIEYIASIDRAEYAYAPTGYINEVQGESARFRSSPTLYGIYDRSSPGTEPYSIDKATLNMIGGVQWNIPGQWIEWEVDVPEDGLYNITFKSRQNYTRDNVSVRRFTINGETPFIEAREISFRFMSDWQHTSLSDESGEPYLFPLKKGTHVIRLEVTLGEMGSFLSEAEQIVNRLTAAYRKILVLVGTTPDPNRDYQVEKVYPEVMEYFEQEMHTLRDLVERVTEYTGTRGSEIASAQTIANRLERFLEKPHTIPRNINGFKLDIGALAAFVVRMSNSPLDIDSVIISSQGAELPKIRGGFFSRIAHELRSFFASFYVDYDSIGDVYDDSVRPLEVWMLSGRDQAQVLKGIIDDSFTPQSGIAVNIRLVAPNVLLPSVVAGTGPDIALQVPASEPVNYAMRGSAIDLSGFAGFNELKSDFFDSSFVPYEFDGGVYALPETQGFPMLFYRVDILAELGLAVPETWDDVIKMLPVLHKSNFDFGLATDDLLSLYGGFLNFLYQRSGTVYNEEGSVTLLDYPVSVDAFEFITSMYTQYKLPKIYTFADRFRTGEMPIGISDYTLFNQLSVSAPEIRGLWDFAPIPGYVGENGEINRSSTGGGVCSMMLPTVKNHDAAWEFLQWWVSAETQTRFGREMESLIGAAARHNTANVRAFEQLAWSGAQREKIMEQWQWVVGTPEVPGGYYTSRHMLNAMRKVMNNNEEPRETLLDYARVINNELYKKRLEFGLITE